MANLIQNLSEEIRSSQAFSSLDKLTDSLFGVPLVSLDELPDSIYTTSHQFGEGSKRY